MQFSVVPLPSERAAASVIRASGKLTSRITAPLFAGGETYTQGKRLPDASIQKD